MIEAVNEHQKKGDYNSITDGNDFAEALTRDLRAVSHDQHLFVAYNPFTLPDQADSSSGPHEPSPAKQARFRRMLERWLGKTGQLAKWRFFFFRSLRWLGRGEQISRRPRRNHTAAFKAKVALAALKGDKTLSELAEKFDVHANQITQWKGQLLEGAAGVFGGESKAGPAEAAVDLKSLHGKIGQLALENDFLEGALTKAGLLSARR